MIKFGSNPQGLTVLGQVYESKAVLEHITEQASQLTHDDAVELQHRLTEALQARFGHV